MVMVINNRIRRVLLENKSQYIGAVLLIIFSCIMFTGMTLVGTNMQRLVSEFRKYNMQEDAVFITDKSISNLQELESAADAVIEEGKTFDYTLSEGKTLRIFSQNDRVNLPAIVNGKGLSGGDILLNPTFAAANNLKIGDTVKITDKSFTIAGFMALPNYIYPLKSETDLMYSPQNFGIAVISRGDYDAFNTGNSFYSVRFNHIDQNPRSQSSQFRALLVSRGIGVLQWTDIGDNKRVTSATMKIESINLMSKSVPVAILLLTGILISTVIRRLISRESEIIGALYALGYRKKELYHHYLILPLVIAITGGSIGTVLGLFTVNPLISLLIDAFNIPLTGIDYNPAVVITSLLLPILFLLGSGYFAVRKELKHSPVELMKGNKEASKVNFLERVLKLEKFKFTAKFKIREQLRSLSRLAFLLLGCAMATMLLLYGFTIKSSLDYLLSNSLTGTLRFQYEYKFKSPHAEAPPVGAEPFSASLFLPSSDAKRDFFICGVMPDSSMLSLVDESGAPLRANQISITKPLADKLKVKKGDTINVVRKEDGRTFALRIESIADTYIGKYIFMPLEVYNEKFGMPQGSYLGLWSNRQLNIPQDQLYSFKSVDESVAAIKESTVTIQVMVTMFSIIAFIIGLIAIYLVTSMIIEENRKSISLLKIFGYRRREVNSLILNSSTFVVAAGYLIGIPLILASMGGLLQTLDNSVGLTLPVWISPTYIIVGFIVVMVAFELSKFMCRKKVNAVSMSEALKLGME